MATIDQVLQNQDLSYLVINHFVRSDIINENRVHFVYVTMYMYFCCMTLYGFQLFLQQFGEYIVRNVQIFIYVVQKGAPVWFSFKQVII